MTYHPAVRIKSADDVPAAVLWAGDNPKNRWYVTRLARAFGKGDLIPDDWGMVTEKPEEHRLTSEQAHMDSAVVDHAVAEDEAAAAEPVTAAAGKKRRTQKVQTEAGVKRYKAPIGTPIIERNGKLVADLHAAARLDGDNAITAPRVPNNRVRPAAIDTIGEADEIHGKDGRALVVVSRTEGPDGHTLVTADAEGTEHHFTVPNGAKVRLIEDDDDLDDDAPEDQVVPDRVHPDMVQSHKAGYLAAKKAAARGEQGGTAKEVAAARARWKDSESQLDTQMGPKDEAPPADEDIAESDMSTDELDKLRMKDHGFDDEHIDKLAADYKKNGYTGDPLQVEDSPRGATLTDGHHRLEAAKKAGIGKLPVKKYSATDKGRLKALKALNATERAKAERDAKGEKPAPKAREAQPATLDLGTAKDKNGEPLDAATPYLINRGTKEWLIDSVEPDGRLNLRAVTPDDSGRNNRYKVTPKSLRRSAPEPEPETPPEPEPLSDTTLASSKDKKRRPVTLAGRYTLNARKGAQVWAVESMNDDGTLTLKPAEGGPRRRRNIKPSKLHPVDPPKTSTKEKLAAAKKRRDEASTKPLRDTVAQDAATVTQLHQQFDEAGNAVDTAKRQRADEGMLAKLVTAHQRARKDLLLARSTYNASSRAAQQAGITDIPRPEQSQALYSRNASSIARNVGVMSDLEISANRTQSQERLDAIARGMLSPALRNERNGHQRVLDATEAEQKKRGTWVEPVPEPVVLDTRGQNADPEYLEGLDEIEFGQELRAARTNGIPEVVAAVEAEDRRRDEMMGTAAPENYATMPDDELARRVEAGEGTEQQLNEMIDEMFAREEDSSTYATIARRVAAGENPWEVEAELTKERIQDIHKREMLRLLHNDWPITADNNNFAQALDTAYKLELREEITRAAEIGGFSTYFSNDAERRFGIAQSDILWTQNEATARANASEELRKYWDEHGRLTKKLFRERLLARIGAQGAGTGSYAGSSGGDFLR